jgi:hypothetical protein
VATCLLDNGVPAVVAMQFPIGDVAAIAFGAGLHRALARGEDVRRAVVEGRLAILDEIPGSLQWITPALFLRHAPVPPAAAAEVPAERRGNTIRIGEIDSTHFTAGAVVHQRGSRPGHSGGGGHHVEVDLVRSEFAVLGATIYGGGDGEE